MEIEPALYTHRLLSAAATDNPNVACEQTCIFKGMQGYNNKAAKVYLKLYEGKAAVNPASTDTPKKTIIIPASGAFVFDFPAGIQFRGGMSYRMTGALADNDTTNLVANDIEGFNLDYSR